MRRIPFILLVVTLLAVNPVCIAGKLPEAATGRAIMDAVYERHQQYPFIYEEQSMVLVDRHGQRQTRKLRRYSRAEASGRVNLLLLFDSPEEVAGVAMLAERTPDGTVGRSVYLPAFGGAFVTSGHECTVACGDNFLGSDFSIESLAGEVLDDYLYIRRDDFNSDEMVYYVIDVHRPGAPGLPLHRHYVLQENLFIARTDYLDDLGRVGKRQTHHDVSRVHGDMWRANMMLMENRFNNHRTIIKIDRRVFSADYVPAEVFTREWLRHNRPPIVKAVEENNPEEVL